MKEASTQSCTKLWSPNVTKEVCAQSLLYIAAADWRQRASGSSHWGREEVKLSFYAASAHRLQLLCRPPRHDPCQAGAPNLKSLNKLCSFYFLGPLKVPDVSGFQLSNPHPPKCFAGMGQGIHWCC